MPYYNRDPKRDHHFDDHPYISLHMPFMLQPKSSVRPRPDPRSMGTGLSAEASRSCSAAQPRASALVPSWHLGLYWGYIGIVENKMETTIQSLGFRAWVLGSLLTVNGRGFRVQGTEDPD